MANRLLLCSGSLDGGGSERQLWQFAVHLQPDQFLAELYLIYRRGPFLELLPQRIPVHAFSDLNKVGHWPGSIHRAQVSHLEKILRQQQIDIVYDRTYHMTLVTSPACRRAKVPRISVIVSPPSLDFGRAQERFKWFKRRMLRAAYSDPLSKAIAVSQAVADDAADYFDLKPSTFIVVPNPVDVEAIQQAALDHSTIPQGAVRNENDFVLRVAVAARMTSEKGHSVMIEAARVWQTMREEQAWRPLVIDFLGDGPLASQLQAEVERLQLSSSVHFRGFQTNPHAWMAQADAICVPSIYEGLPNVALEACALRKPLISTACSDSLTNLLGKGCERGTIVPVGDPSAIAQAMLQLLRQPKHFQQCADRAYEWVVENHSLTRWLKSMQSLANDVLNRGLTTSSRNNSIRKHG